MWSFFSKDPSKELSNFEIQEQIVLDPGLEQKTIWSLNNAKKKGSTSNTPAQQANELVFSSYSYNMKVGNETWVKFWMNSIFIKFANNNL